MRPNLMATRREYITTIECEANEKYRIVIRTQWRELPDRDGIVALKNKISECCGYMPETIKDINGVVILSIDTIADGEVLKAEKPKVKVLWPHPNLAYILSFRESLGDIWRNVRESLPGQISRGIEFAWKELLDFINFMKPWTLLCYRLLILCLICDILERVKKL